MSRLERNRHYMLADLVKVTENYRTLWEGLPDFVEPMAQLKVYSESYVALLNEKQTLQVSIRQARDDQWETFGQKLHQLAGFLYKKAGDAGDKDTMSLVDVSTTSLLRQSFRRTIGLAHRILIQADLMVTEDDSDLLKELKADAQALFDDFSTNGRRPRERQVKSGSITKQLRDLFREIAAFLRDKLDPLMRLFRETDLVFFDDYQRARIVPKLTGKRSTSSNDPDDDPDDDAVNGSEDGDDEDGEDGQDGDDGEEDEEGDEDDGNLAET